MYLLNLKSMNKKKIRNSIITLLILAVVFAVVRHLSAENYLHVLPPRPKALSSFSVDGLAEQMNIKNNKVLKLLDKYSLTDCGVDWTKKIYVFISERERVGLLASVSDRGKLQRNLRQWAEKNICTSPEEHYGIVWSVIKDSWIVAFDRRALLIMGPSMSVDQDMLRREMLDCFRQRKDQAGFISPLFKSLSEDVPIGLISRMDLLPMYVEQTIRDGLPEHTDLGDVYIRADFNFSTNGLTANLFLQSQRAEIPNYFEHLFNWDKPISATYVTKVPTDAVAWACINVNGDSLLLKMREIPSLRTILLAINMNIDADMMIRSINGDMAFTLGTQSSDKDFLMMAEIDNTDFLNQADSWQYSRNTVQRVDDSIFSISAFNNKTYFGVSEKSLFLSSKPDVTKLTTDSVTSLQMWLNTISSNRFFLWLNMQRLTTNLASHGFLIDDEMLRLFHQVVIYGSDSHHLTLDMRSNDIDNVWEKIADTWTK